MGKALAEQQSAVPALYNAESDITADDVVLPKVKIGQFSSGVVKDGLVGPGDIFTVQDSDDPEPVVLDEAERKVGAKKGVVFHVLGLKKGWSYSEDGGDLERWAFDSPDRHPDAWVTYTYLIVIPSADVDVPFKLLLTKSGKPAALKINSVLKRNAARPIYGSAFRLTTAFRERGSNAWYVAQVGTADAMPEQVVVAGNIARQMSGNSADLQATGDEPEL